MPQPAKMSKPERDEDRPRKTSAPGKPKKAGAVGSKGLLIGLGLGGCALLLLLIVAATTITWVIVSRKEKAPPTQAAKKKDDEEPKKAAEKTKPEELILGKWQMTIFAGRPVSKLETMEFTTDGKAITIMPEGSADNTFKFLDDGTLQLYKKDKAVASFSATVRKDSLTLHHKKRNETAEYKRLQ